MKPTPPTALAALALLLTATLAGCTSSPEATTFLQITFDAGHAPVDSEVRPTGCTLAGDSSAEGTSPASAPATCTAKDQILHWSQTSGVPVDIEHFSFGDCLGRIDGIPATSGCQAGATAFWNLAINGVNASVGMDQAELHAGDRVAWTLIALPGQSTPPPAPEPETPKARPSEDFTLAVQETPATRNATITVAGSVTHPALLSFALVDGNETTALPALHAQGAWSVEVDAPVGQSTLQVTADDGSGTSLAEVALVRLAKGTMQVDFRGVQPSRDDEVWFDPDSSPSSSYYQGQPVAHPGKANVHDLMVAWTAQTGIPIVYKPHASFGQQVMQIDGVGDVTGTSSAFWCYQYNGASASFGITQQEFKDGDVVKWSLGTVC